MAVSGEVDSPAAERRGASALESASIGQLGIYLVVATWWFGGGSTGARTALCWLGTIGAALVVASALLRPAARKKLRWLWPLLLLNAMVLFSLSNVNVRELQSAGETMYARTGGRPNLPSTADPAASLDSLWLLNGIYLSCFQIFLAIERRRRLRLLLLFAVGNAVALAILGSSQKLVGAKGLYFGAVDPGQPAFFATFIYHNHWGAFALMMTALALGLAHFYAGRRKYQDFWHSPAPSALLAGALIAASIPLSTSRSATLLLLVVVLASLAAWTMRIWRIRTAQGRSPFAPLALCLVVAAAGLGAGYKLAQPVIEQRFAKTREQLAELERWGNLGARGRLYRDTWRMARDKIAFGWGMGSYPRIFYTYNSLQFGPEDRLPIFYRDAHSDWLQAAAELGIAGMSVIGLLAIVPAIGDRRAVGTASDSPEPLGPLPACLLGGCALILAYAWVEFPFGNPAVVFTWWLCFFAAIRYRRLSDRDPAPR